MSNPKRRRRGEWFLGSWKVRPGASPIMRVRGEPVYDRGDLAEREPFAGHVRIAECGSCDKWLVTVAAHAAGAPVYAIQTPTRRWLGPADRLPTHLVLACECGRSDIRVDVADLAARADDTPKRV